MRTLFIEKKNKHHKLTERYRTYRSRRAHDIYKQTIIIMQFSILHINKQC